MKYKLTNQTIQHKGRTLYRIQALMDFRDVKTGDLGGWVESEKNLSQEGLCWIYDEGKVYGNAWVFGNSIVVDSNVSSYHYHYHHHHHHHYHNHLIIPSPEHPLFVIYRLKYPDLEVEFIP